MQIYFDVVAVSNTILTHAPHRQFIRDSKSKWYEEVDRGREREREIESVYEEAFRDSRTSRLSASLLVTTTL